jgi:hypothetical protein
VYGRRNLSNDEEPDASRSEAASRIDRNLRKLHPTGDSTEPLLERKARRKKEDRQ